MQPVVSTKLRPRTVRPLHATPRVSRSSLRVRATALVTDNGAAAVSQVAHTKIVAFSAKRYVLDYFESPFTSIFPQCTFVEAALDYETATLAAGADVAVIFVNDVASREVVQKLALGGVKLLACRCAGYDRVDLAACQEFGVRVVRVPVYSPQSVAEHAIALMFCLNRNLHSAHMRVQQGNYTLSGLVGFEMNGKTAGVIGTGAIGAHACKVLKGIGLRVLAHDIRPSPDLIAMGVEYTSVEEMLPQCDIISLHCPLLPSTRHIVNAERLALMKDGVLLINVSRGGLIDSDALADALENGKIGGLGMDVYENEGNLFFEDFTMYDIKTRMRSWDRRFKTLLSFPQVLVTPHSAFLTKEALNNIANTTIQNITEFALGHPLTNEVRAK